MCYSTENNASKIEASSQNDFCLPEKSCQFRYEGINFVFIVRSEDIEIITVAIAFHSCAMLND